MLVLGITSEKVTDWCSIASDSYNRREEKVAAAYSDRVDAGITEASEDITRIEGEFEVEGSSGI